MNRSARAAALGAFASLLLASPVVAETINCTNITALPATITVQGVYCLKQDLSTNISSGNAINIAANNVTIDFNGFKLGGLAAGLGTQAVGVFASNRQNITLRNGNIRGFRTGISLVGTGSNSAGHVIEDNLLDASTRTGVNLVGSTSSVIRGNRVINTKATSGGFTLGIAVEFSGQVDVVDNLIVATTNQSPNGTFAIRSFGSSTVNIIRNTILDTQAASNFAIGIFVISGSTMIADNSIIGGAGATGQVFGIASDDGTTLCLNNTVSGFADGQATGCTSEAGTFPPP